MSNGKPGFVDMKEAAKYMKIAADWKNWNAIKCYAKMLKKGNGVPKDKNEAKKYEELAKQIKKEKKSK